MVCQNETRRTLWDDWKTLWGPALLEHYSYISRIPWCFEWVGKVNETGKVSHKDTSQRVKVPVKWTCEEVYSCDSSPAEVRIPAVQAALKLGCECRNYKHQQQGYPNGQRQQDCEVDTIRSPGNLVWVMGHGQWTTHLSLDGPVTQITLGIPTLCPLWNPVKSTQVQYSRTRTKREVNSEEDIWHEPDANVKFEWVLESMFAPLASYRNREMLFKLLGQTERLAAATKKGFKDLNLQLQATSRMTLQNRMALDMMLLKEHGVCGYLSDKIDHCCIHIPNVTREVEKDIFQLQETQEKIKEIEKEAQQNWIGALFNSLGLHLSDWLSSLIQTIITIIIMFLVLYLMYCCIKAEIGRNRAWTHRLVGAVSREYPKEIHLNDAYEETTQI